MSDPTNRPGFSDPEHDDRLEAEREKAKALRDEPAEPLPSRVRFKDPHEVSCDHWDRIISQVEKQRGWQ